MATTTINTRLALKSDTSDNWGKSTLVLLKGEPAIEITESGNFKIKIGDGIKVFSELPYVTITPTEISKLITDSSIQSVSISTGDNNGQVAITVDGTKTNASVKGLGSAAYTESAVYATASHTHAIANVTGLQAALDGKSATTHTHDDRYYTETEMNTKLAGKANSSHIHKSDDITSLDAAKLTGKISIERLPAGALERCVIVETDEKRLALTTSDVQKGDTVKVTGTGKMYFVIDDAKLNSEEGYTVYTAGSATSVPWSGVTGKPSTYTPSAHTHTKSQITDFPAALKNPNSMVVKLNGGTTEGTNMFTYNGSAEKSINITPAVIGASASGHTHNYAGSSSTGGAATSAVKLSTARNFSITGGAVASAVSFNGNANVALSVSSLNTDYLTNGSNTLILSCGGAS